MIPTRIESATAARIFSQSRRTLPDGYLLSENDVFCGRGSLGVTHIGNRRFRDLVMANADRYVHAASKFERSNIIYEVVDHIRKMSPQGGFVKIDGNNGCFYEVGDIAAREKASQAFRDATQGKYKSSRMTKARNRMTVKLRKACERFDTSMNVPSTTPIPPTTESCGVRGLSPVLSASSGRLPVPPSSLQQQRNIQNNIRSELQTTNSVCTGQQRSDPFDFNTALDSCSFDFCSKLVDSTNCTTQNLLLNDDASSAKQIVMPDSKELDAMTFDLLLNMVEQDASYPYQGSCEPTPIE